ncbi:acyltransferase family protein [Rhodopseudomonas telluris]|uniref:Acyltransferase family protein n=1 Tax=Rhodopseudomonas telluris TaxID=644215 RepID=A0ABV6EXN9_9BRAD
MPADVTLPLRRTTDAATIVRSATKLDGIQALRALAANAVLLAHLTVIERKYNHGVVLLPGWFDGGVFGVDVFFVISGFIMASLTTRSWTGFAGARAVRILPPYWFYTTLVLVASLIRPQWVNSALDQAPSIWRSYLLIPGSTFPLLAVGWTLIHEAYFYVVFALILALRLPYAVAVAGWAGIIGAVWLLFPAEAQNQASFPMLALAVNPLTFEFIGGVLVALALRRFGPRYPAVVLAVGVVALLASIGLTPDRMSLTYSDGLWLRIGLIGLPCAAIVYGMAGLELHQRLGLPSWMMRLGDASYSTYLAHVLVASAIGRAMVVLPFGGVAYEVILLVACMVMANVVGLFSFRWLETPMIRLGRKLV